MTDCGNNYRNDRQEKRSFLSFSIVAFLVTAGMSINPVRAEQASPAHNVTDGHPWKMTMEDGRVGTLVLFQNGTGKMTGGPMELSPKWRATPDGLCLKPGALLPERCVKLVRSGNGYIGLKAGKLTFKLER